MSQNDNQFKKNIHMDQMANVTVVTKSHFLKTETLEV